MVLADDNFATIVHAVEEGRKIYENVCKVIQFQLSTNMSEVIVMFLSTLLHFTILTPVHLLWINMVTDSLPGLALGMEHAEGNLMRRKPRASTDGIFSGGAGYDMVWQGIYLAFIELAAYFIGYHLEFGNFAGIFSGEICVNAMAMAFLTMNFAEMMCAINMRSRRGSILSGEMFKNMNWWLFGAFCVTTLLTLLAVYLPGLQQVFDIDPGTFQAKELYISIVDVHNEYAELAFTGRKYQVDQYEGTGPKYSDETIQLRELQTLLYQIIEDDEVSESEAVYLREWLNSNYHLRGNYPYDRVYDVLEKVFEDGVVESEELQLLLDKFTEFTNPACSTCESISSIADKHFVLTGEFSYGSRSSVEEYIQAKGGIIDNTVKKATDFVIIGSLGSQAWKNGTYGGKIKKAMELKDKGCNVELVAEEDFFSKEGR